MPVIMIKKIDQIIGEFIGYLGVPQGWNELISSFIEFLLTLIISYLLFLLFRKFINVVLKSIARKTESAWDDILIERRVFNRLAYLAPVYLAYFLIPTVFEPFPDLILFFLLVLRVCTIIIVMLVILAFLNAVLAIYQQYEISKSRPIKGYLQVIKIVVYILVSISIISVLIGKSATLLIGGFGAFSAVAMLVFKDSLLGLAAGVQLTANDMLRTGDWITLPKYDVDGTVIDITLTTIKIQNGDKTISTIPAYSLFSDSFRNWRGMEESGGRRIKRWINIDMNSISFCTPEMIEKFKQFQSISNYIVEKEEQIKKHNADVSIDPMHIVNSRRQTNIGIFRAYLMAYLQNRQDINIEMTFMVRQLQPTETGLPIEIIAFSKEKTFAGYEGVQSDIFDHILAVIPEFDLRVFQNPTGNDFMAVGRVASIPDQAVK
jgi:miniconductance mechanosensitive channel